MPIIKIDEKEYELDLLSNQAKEQLASLQFVDAELQRLTAQTAVLQTARMAYAKALQEALPKEPADMSGLVFGNQQ
jgi:PIN domain nuclease of toxin-antitoxin system